MLVPVESVAVRTVPLEEGLVMHGVLMTGEGPLVAEEVVDVEVEEDLEEVGVEVACDCADELWGLD